MTSRYQRTLRLGKTPSSGYFSPEGVPKVQTYLSGGAVPTFTHHRFWAQADIALALADFGRLFPID